MPLRARGGPGPPVPLQCPSRRDSSRHCSSACTTDRLGEESKGEESSDTLIEKETEGEGESERILRKGTRREGREEKGRKGLSLT